MAEYLEKKSLIAHIENECRKWGDDYDIEQVLGDIEDMPDALNKIKQEIKQDDADKNVGESEDCISRQAVIKATTHYAELPIKQLMEILKSLPSVKPTRAKGRWVNTAKPEYSDNIVCETCGYDSIAKFSYCPNCGAEMGGGGGRCRS